jgi:hypothetical protein
VTDAIRTGYRTAITAIAPAVLAAGFLYHPFIPNLTDASAVAAAANQDTFRWGLSHLMVGVGSGFIALAFLAIRSWLRDAGEERWSAAALPFVVMGSVLFAILPGMEFAVLAAVETGAEVAAAQAAVDPWFVPVLLTGSAIFALGILGFAMGIVRGGILSPRLRPVVVGALVVMAVVRFVPLGLVLFYVGSAATILALWPLAYDMWRHSAQRPAEQARTLQAG